ncbi:MAG: PilZ domain-containing protein [Deltaproteobacteria bacterium]|nr:PilZ domain-containing protein [Deltaproteobacteria bacterium]
MEERRGNQRVLSRFEINYVDEGDYLISYSKDLSVDGMFVSTDSPPAVGEETKLTFSIGDIDQVTVDARVVWVNTSNQEDKSGMGVEFIDPPDSLKAAILESIKKIAVLLNGTKK